MEFRPPRAVGTIMGAALAAWSFFVCALLVARAAVTDVGLEDIALYITATIFFGVGALFAYWTYSLGTLRYTLDRNALTITWGDIRQAIPITQIERLVPGRELPNPHIAGVSWLGHHVGKGQVEGGVGDTLFYSTHRSPEHLLYVVTPTQSYALTIDDEVGFAEAVQAQQRIGSLIAVPQAPDRLYLAAQPFWADPVAQGLALTAFAAFFAMFAYVYQQYPGLPPTIALDFPEIDGITRIGSKSELLKIPAAGICILLANLALGFIAHSWERMVGYLLLSAAIVAQVTLLAAAIMALN
jgi:hypothetical protein